MTSLSKQIATLTAKMEPAMQRAFIAGAKGIRDRAKVGWPAARSQSFHHI